MLFFFHRFLLMMLRPTPPPPVPGIPGVGIPCWRPSVAWDPNHQSFFDHGVFFFECLNGHIFGASVIKMTVVHKVYIYSKKFYVYKYMSLSSLFQAAPFFHGELPSIFSAKRLCFQAAQEPVGLSQCRCSLKSWRGLLSDWKRQQFFFWTQKRLTPRFFFLGNFGIFTFYSTLFLVVFFFLDGFWKKGPFSGRLWSSGST